MRIRDGEYKEDTGDDSVAVVRALTAGGGPLFPPSDWYKDPGLNQPTPITVTKDGRIFGHIATWDTDHIGLPPGTKPPRSAHNYAYFRTGKVETDDGNDVLVGQLTLAGGHAPITADAAAAVEHYDNTKSAVADLAAGEDQHGIWVSGGVRPDVTPEQIRALRASAPSGDWRPINGALELVAVCQVNTPGFPVAHAMVASGEITALVAAGARQMYRLQQDRELMRDLARLESRVEETEAVIASLTAGAKKSADKTHSSPFDKLLAEDDDSAKEDAPADDEKPKDKGESKPGPADKKLDKLRERRAKLRK
jgi:hypothetical protein